MSEETRPFPGPLFAVLLTLLGSFLAGLVIVSVGPYVTPTAALGLGTVIGLGAAAALGAASVPQPHAERVGLMGLRRHHCLPLLLLLPTALLASELDNVVRAVLPPPDAQQVAERVGERLPTDNRLAFVETLIVAAGLVPVIEEWLFRGVIQQGLVASMGAKAGLVATALLFAIGHGSPAVSAQTWIALVAETFVMGLALGYARFATGSLLAPILLHVGFNLCGVLAMAYARQLPIAGYNAPGAHTPVLLLGAAAVSVALGLRSLSREPPPAIPELEPGDGD